MNNGVQQDTESERVMSLLYINKELNDPFYNIKRQMITSDNRDFQIEFVLSEYLSIQLISWIPAENRICNVYIESILLEHKDGKKSFFPIENLSSNGERISKHEFQIVNENESINISFLENEQLYKITIKGSWFIRSSNETFNCFYEKNKILKTNLNEMGNKNYELKNINQTLVNKNNELKNINQTLVNKNNELKNINQTLVNKNNELENINQTLVNKNNELENINQTLVNKNNELENINQTLVNKNNELEILEKKILGNPIIGPLNSITIKILDYLYFRKESKLIRESTYFNSDWYLNTYRDVKDNGVDPVEHYTIFGWHELRDPSSEFSTQSYLNKYPDVLESDLNPLFHYERYGKKEGRTPIPSSIAKQKNIPPNSTIALKRNNQYYLSSNSSEYTYIPPSPPYNIQEIINELEFKPKFSLIIPVYNTPLNLLKKVVESVKMQWYSNWELIIANDASTNVDTNNYILNIKEKNIFIINLEKNKGISGATNTAIEHASGDYIVLLDHDDELTENCLYELSLCINQNHPDYIYSDEDKISPEGLYTEPHFKPDWSPDTLMSTMYVCHVSCIKRSLWNELGGLRSDVDGCQDWDFILRLAEKTNKICHIPKVLYHWRIIPGSIASNISAKSYVQAASKKVREDAINRRGLIGIVEPIESVDGYFRVNYLLKSEPLISIIIPTRDNAEILGRCIESIVNTSTHRNYELIILDNGSVHENSSLFFHKIKNLYEAKVIRHDNPFNFSELNNIGAKHSHGEILLFLNDDTEVITPDWLERMGGYAQLPHIGAVGAKLVYPNGKKIQHAGILNLQNGPGHAFIGKDINDSGYYMRNLLEYNWLAVTGACLMIEREKFDIIGGFDESFPIAYNDVDFCFRLYERGYFSVMCQVVKLIHHESISRGNDNKCYKKVKRLESEKKQLYEKHPNFFQYDPFYNINLHPNGINFENVF